MAGTERSSPRKLRGSCGLMVAKGMAVLLLCALALPAVDGRVLVGTAQRAAVQDVESEVEEVIEYMQDDAEEVEMVSSFVLEASGKVSLGHVKPNATARGVGRVAESRDPQSSWWDRGKQLHLKSSTTVFFLGAPLALLALLHLLTVAFNQPEKGDEKAGLKKKGLKKAESLANNAEKPQVNEKEMVLRPIRKKKQVSGKEGLDVVPALQKAHEKENVATENAAEENLTLREQEDLEALEIELKIGVITLNEYKERWAALGHGHNSFESQSKPKKAANKHASVCSKQTTPTVQKVLFENTKESVLTTTKQDTEDTGAAAAPAAAAAAALEDVVPPTASQEVQPLCVEEDHAADAPGEAATVAHDEMWSNLSSPSRDLSSPSRDLSSPTKCLRRTSSKLWADMDSESDDEVLPPVWADEDMSLEELAVPGVEGMQEDQSDESVPVPAEVALHEQIVIPTKEVLTGLHEQILAHTKYIDNQLEEQHEARKGAMGFIHAATQHAWPSAYVRVYGSSRGHRGALFALPSSDVDMVVCGIMPRAPQVTDEILLQKLSNALSAMPKDLSSETDSSAQSVNVVRLQGKSILKMVRNGIRLDVSVDSASHSGVRTSEFVRLAGERFPMLRPITLVLKRLLQLHGLGDPYSGGLSGYGVVLLATRHLMDWTRQHPSSHDLGKALLDMLIFFGEKFCPKSMGVRVAHGESYVLCSAGSQCPWEFAPLFIEDPEQRGNNVGVTAWRFSQVQAMFRGAAEALRHDGDLSILY